jgi:hypothetical protein
MVAVTKKNISMKKSQRGGSFKVKPLALAQAESVKVDPIGKWTTTKNFFTPTTETIESAKNSATSALAFLPAATVATGKAAYETGKFFLKLPGAVVASPVLGYQGIKLLSKGREVNKARGFSQSNVTKKLEEFNKKKTEWEKLQEKTNINKKAEGLSKQRTAEQKLILNLTEKINRQSGRKPTNERSLNPNAGTEILKILRTNDGKGEFKTGDALQSAIAAGYEALAETKKNAYDERQQNKVFKNTAKLRSKKAELNTRVKTGTDYINNEKNNIEADQLKIKQKTEAYMNNINIIEKQHSTVGITDSEEIKKLFKDKNIAIEKYKNQPNTKKLVKDIQILKNNIIYSEYLIKREETILNPYQKELSEVEKKISLYIPKKFSNLEKSYNRRKERFKKTKTYYKNIVTDPFTSVARTYKSVRDPLKKFEIKKAFTPNFKGFGKDILSGITPSVGTYKVTNIPNINIFDDTTKFNIFESRTSKYVKLAELYEKELKNTEKLSLDDRIKNKKQINKIYEYFNDKKQKYVDTLSNAKTQGINRNLYNSLIKNNYSGNIENKEKFETDLNKQKEILTSQINEYTKKYKNTSVTSNADKKIKQDLYNEQLKLINELRAITVLESFNKIQNIKKESDDLVTEAIAVSENRPLLLQQSQQSQQTT